MVHSSGGTALHELTHELCDLLSEATETRVRPHPPTSYAELVAAFRNGDVGVAWMPPVPAVEFEDRGLARPLALPARNGSTHYHAALVVRRTGPKTLDDLKGRRAAWVHPDSASGYLVPRIHLASQMLDVFRLFSRELFVGSHLAVVDAVASGNADVGATFCHLGADGQVLGGGWLGSDGQPLRPVEVLKTIGPIPNDAIIASTRLPSAIHVGVARWFLTAKGRAREVVSGLAQADDFRVATAEHFDGLRHMLRVARARGYSSRPPVDV